MFTAKCNDVVVMGLRCWRLNPSKKKVFLHRLSSAVILFLFVIYLFLCVDTGHSQVGSEFVHGIGIWEGRTRADVSTQFVE